MTKTTAATCHICGRQHTITPEMRIGTDGKKLTLRAAVALAHYYGPRAAAPVCHICGGTHEVTDAMRVDSATGEHLTARAALEVAHYYHATVATTRAPFVAAR
jgi:hypothetical protein